MAGVSLPRGQGSRHGAPENVMETEVVFKGTFGPRCVPRGARPPGGRGHLVGWYFIFAKYFRVLNKLSRCKSARPRGRTGAAWRRVPRL